MKVSIGILAYNEAENIRSTLNSLSKQSFFDDLSNYEAVEIVVVPNGCTDNTAALATSLLTEIASKLQYPHFRWSVCEVKRPGKSNAWNCYVHDFASSSADYLILMDSDIEFISPNTIQNLLDMLETNPEVWVSKDLPVKDIALKARKNLIEIFLAKVSEPGESCICGQLYCGRASILRKIWMPPDLSVEDGFLAAMIETDLFTTNKYNRRIRFAPDASHAFKAYVNVSALLDHEKRLVLGTLVNAHLFGYLWANCNQSQDAGSLVKFNNDQQPDWLKKIVEQAFDKRNWWLIPRWMMFRRFSDLQQQPLLKIILKLPITVIAFLVDQFVFVLVNQELHTKDRGLGYWQKNDASSSSVPTNSA